MSYKQAMKWARKHPKGTKQPVIMSTNSGFWPAQAWLEGEFYPYLEECAANGTTPMTAKELYDSQVRR